MLTGGWFFFFFFFLLSGFLSFHRTFSVHGFGFLAAGLVDFLSSPPSARGLLPSLLLVIVVVDHRIVFGLDRGTSLWSFIRSPSRFLCLLSSP